MFERYTERARRVIFFARYETSNFGSTTIETEHLLLGLIREDKNLTNRFLRNSSSIVSIREEIEGRMTNRERVSTSIDLPLSGECERILSYAAEEADRLNHRHIGTEHLLLGILREEQCLAAEILRKRGLQLQVIREELARTAVDLRTAADAFRQDQPQKGDMVPDAATAKRIAQAIWTPAYGADTTAIQGELQVALNGSVWLVTTGPLFAFIRSMDGSVVAMGRNNEGANV